MLGSPARPPKSMAPARGPYPRGADRKRTPLNGFAVRPVRSGAPERCVTTDEKALYSCSRACPGRTSCPSAPAGSGRRSGKLPRSVMAAAAPVSPLNIVERVRATTARVTASARHVTLGDDAAFAAAATELSAAARAAGLGEGDGTTSVDWDAEGWHYCADATSGGPLTCQYVFVLDSLNWCFWPSSTALEYDSLAVGLRKVLEADAHAFSAARLKAVTADDVRAWLAPHNVPQAEERAEMLHEVSAPRLRPPPQRCAPRRCCSSDRHFSLPRSCTAAGMGPGRGLWRRGRRAGPVMRPVRL